MKSPDVVITGLGVVSALGIGARSNWDAAVARRSGIGPMSGLECPPGPERIGGEAPLHTTFELEKTRGLYREVEGLMLALDEAQAMAGVDLQKRADPSRTAVVLGTTLAGMRRAAAFCRGSPAACMGMFLAGDVAREVAIRVGAGGVCASVSAACASGLSSIIHARALLQTGRADVVIAGGYDPIAEYAFGGFNSLRLVAPHAIRPFTRGREGMKLGEGYALFVLERAADAHARGACPIARVAGAGESSDGFHLTRPQPEGEGLARAVRQALDAGRLSPADIGMISLHGTGTPANDAAEHAALAAVFGSSLPRTPATAFKAACGHALGGAGAIELALSCLALRSGKVPPSAGLVRDEIEFEDLDLGHPEPRPMPQRRTLGISLGFGGSNAAVVLDTPPATADHPTFKPGAELAVLGLGFFGCGLNSAGELADALRSGRVLADRDDLRSTDESVLDEQAGGRRARRMSTYAKLMLASTRQAIEHAGHSHDPAFLREAAAFLGSTHGACAYTEHYYNQIVAEGVDAASPWWFAEGVPNVGSAHVSMAFGVGGTAQTIIGTRTAALDALLLAAARFEASNLDHAIVAAAEEQSDMASSLYAAFGLHASAGVKRGFVTGPGSAAIVLGRAEAPREPGAPAFGSFARAAARTAAERTVSAVAHAVDSVLEELGDPRHVLLSANRTWLATAETLGLARSAARTGHEAAAGTLYSTLPELFAAGPMAGVVAALTLGGLPAGPEPGPRARGVLWPGRVVETPQVGIIASGYDGSVRGVLLNTT